MPATEIAASDLKQQIKKIGDDLVRHHGQKYFYAADQVQAANQRCLIAPAFACWSYAAYTTALDFNAYHQSIGEVHDQAAMKVAIFSSLRDTLNQPLSNRSFSKTDLLELGDCLEFVCDAGSAIADFFSW